MEKKLLPIGKQDFKKLIESNCIYVDKTEHIYRLVTQGFYYFLSRPRRFGKSLLVSTVKELFEGNRPLFEGTWIEKKMGLVENQARYSGVFCQNAVSRSRLTTSNH